MDDLYSVADLHNFGNGNIVSPEDELSVAAHIDKFTRASLYSTTNELYNTVQTVKSWTGAEALQRELSSYLQDVDTNLVDYYTEHKDAIDIVGFIASSLAPGLGSIKVLRAGQKALATAAATGKIGGTLKAATGLLVPKTDMYLKRAIADITASDAPFTAMRGSVLKSLGSGFHQNLLESAAFETAVAATMYNSPILSAMDTSDLLWNGMIFAGLGGVIGGTIQGASTWGKVKAGVKQFQSEVAPWETILKPSQKSTASEKFAHYVMERDRVPPTPTLTGDEATDVLIRRKQDKAATRTKSIELEMRAAATELTKGDALAAQTFWENVKNLPQEEALSSLIQLEDLGRVSTRMSLEQELKKLQSKIAKDILDPEVAALQSRADEIGLRYFYVTGPHAGTSAPQAPNSIRLADTLTKNQSIEIKGNKVIAGKQSFTFDPKVSKDISTLKPYEAEAYRLYLGKSRTVEVGEIIPESDILLIDRAYQQGVGQVNIKLEDGSVRNFTSPLDLLTFIRENKAKYANKILETKKGYTHEEIAHILDIEPTALGQETKVDSSDLFATQKYAKAYTQRLVDSGILHPNDPVVDITNIPSVLKASYNLKAVKDVDGNTLMGEMILKEQQRLYQETADRTFATFMPQGTAELFGEIGNKELFEVDIFSPGRGFAGSSNSPYSTLGNKVEFMGQLTNKAISKAQETWKENFNPILHKLLHNQDAAIEFEVLKQTVRGIPDNYILSPTGESNLVLKKLADYEKKVAEAVEAGGDPAKIKLPDIDPQIPKEIPIKNQDTLDLVERFIGRDSERVVAHSAMRSVEGITESRLAGVFYAPAPSPRDYKHFAFVVDKSIRGFQRSKMIYAQTAEQLDQLIAATKRNGQPHWEVLTKRDAENWYKAIGQFEYEKTLKDINFDAELKRAGVSSPIIVPTDSKKIVADFIDWNMQRESSLVRELVLHKYQPQVDTLKKLGDKYTNIATSQKGSKSLLKYAEDTVENPYADYVKTLLGIPRSEEYAWWFGPQKLLDKTISRMYEVVTDMRRVDVSPAQLEKINQTLQEYGFKGPGYDVALERWANHSAPQGALSSFGRKGNALLATATLRLDFLNSVNNVIGSHVLYYSEIQSILKALERGDANSVGKLAALKINVPGTSDAILSPTKLHGKAINNYFEALRNPESGLLKQYRELGYITSITDQYRHVLDELTLSGKESIKDLETRMGKASHMAQKFVEKGEKITGNRFAEEYNRFVAADTARQIFQLGVDAGLITEKEMWANVGTFVRRTQGTYDAFLRPAVFQGAVGQMIGLFQTYQFNLMQQLLRHVAEGDAKDAMLMMGLQGSIYGLNGMPAFNAINTHIVGTMSGNPEHKDFYSTVYSGVGKNVGEWLMYGSASNILGLVHEDLKTSLYTRGDINPRHLTVVPSSMEDVPLYTATAKIMGGMKAMFQNIANGGDVWNSFLQGVQHSSVNRPLAGLAQIMQFTDNPTSRVYGTTAKGYVIASNELLSLSNLSRLAGGKPFDQAVAQDFGWRAQVYNTNTSERKSNLGRAIRTSTLMGKEPDPVEVENFAQKWVNLGGNQEEFNQFFLKQMVEGDKEAATRLAKTLKSPTLQRLQKQLGGTDPYEVERDLGDQNPQLENTAGEVE